MSTKQDRVAPRTASDLERKYSFGQKFSEIIGLIDDTQKEVYSTSSSLRSEMLDQSTSIRRDTEKIVFEATATIKEDLDTVNNSVKAVLDSEDFSIKVRKAVSSGVALDVGYTFDATGLNISKSGDQMQNLLDNTGMYVNRGGDNILTANDKGVVAQDLHAKTWLIIGSNSRIEDYGIARTGCFWVGD